MSFKIESNGRILGDKGNLCGMITPATEYGKDGHRVEMMMKIDTVASTKSEAIAFARGVEAALRAYKIIPEVKP